jgi:hypothetical protein
VGTGWTGAFRPGENGAPLIRDALVNFECSLERALDGGDHTILLGRVTRIVAGDAGRSAGVFTAARTGSCDEVLQRVRRPIELRVPEGDDRDRYVCASCEHIHYVNPRVIVGCLPVSRGPGAAVQARHRAALRPLDPARGLHGKRRDHGRGRGAGDLGGGAGAGEQSAAVPGLRRALHQPGLHVLSLRLDDGAYGVGPESLETALYAEDEIPWDEIAFPVVRRPSNPILTTGAGTITRSPWKPSAAVRRQGERIAVPRRRSVKPLKESRMAFPKIGNLAPAFTLQDQDGNKVSLKQFRDEQNVVLYFYPKAMTPGCTVQACGLRDSQAS